MPEAQSRMISAVRIELFPFGRIEPLLGFALGTSGGLLQGMVLRTSLLSGGLLGAAFGLAFGLFFARRATSPGAGLIWGLGSSFLLWILTAGGFFHLASVCQTFSHDVPGRPSTLLRTRCLCALPWNARRGRIGYSGRTPRVQTGQKICLGPRHSSWRFRWHARRSYLR